MLTSFWVKCPHTGCGWSGSLLPGKSATDAWRTARPTLNTVAFHCPRCGGEWHARLVGDDVRPLTSADRQPQTVQP